MQTSSVRPVLRAFAALCVFCLYVPLQTTILAQTAADSAASSANQLDRVLPASVGTASSPVRLPGHIPRWVSDSADLGPVAGSKTVQLTVGLSRSPDRQAAFTALLDSQQNSSSPRYHQWLTPEQIGAQFGPTQHDVEAVANWLKAQGFTIQSISPARTAILASAPASVVAQALHTQLHMYVVGTDRLQGPTVAPSVPAVFAPVISYFSGLADVPYHTNHKLNRVPVVPASPATPSGSKLTHPNYTSSDLSTHYMFPGDFNIIYNVEALLNTGTNGSGQKIAIIGGSRLAPSDISTWESLSSLPPVQPNYIVPPGLTEPNQTSDGSQEEATLDFERAFGTAPGATVDFLLDKNWLNTSDTDMLLQYEVNTLRDPVLSLSIGVCEADVPASQVLNDDSIFSQAAAQGISIFVSSGDSGVAGCENHGSAAPATPQIASINALCASSYVTCVGGTQFSDLANPSTYWSPTNSFDESSALSYIPEGAFNEPAGQTPGTYQIFAGGGGPSTIIPKPSWQTGPGVPADGARDTPDVSFSSSDHDGYLSCLGFIGADCNSGGAIIFSGTSAAAPSMAGIAALINAQTTSQHGNFNPLLYRVAAQTPADFHDATPATSGTANCSVATPSTCNNSTPGPNSLTGGLAGYPLTPGYDLATGLGSLDVSAFAHTAMLPSTQITLSVSPNPATISQALTFTATVSPGVAGSGTPTGLVQFYVNGVPSQSPVTLASGVAVLSNVALKPAAIYNVTANYFGDSAFDGAASLPQTVSVTNPNAVPSTSSITVNPSSGVATQAITLVVTVNGSKGTPTGNVSVMVDSYSYGNPVPLVNGSVTLSGLFLPSGQHIVAANYVGDDNYAPSGTPAVIFSLTQGSSATSISISPTTITSTGSTAISATVTGAPGAPVPTGTVNLFSGSQSLGTLPLNNGSVSGQLTGTTQQPITPGIYPFDFVYSGDGFYASSTSSTANLVVTGAGIALGTASPSLTIAAGSHASDAITVSSSTFAGVEGLTCAVVYNGSGAAQSLPTCALSPTSLTLSANGSASSTLTVSTTAAHAVGGGNVSSNRDLTFGGFGGVAFAALLLGLLPRRDRRRWRAVRLLSMLVFLAASLTMLSGCGGGSSSGSPGATTAGTTAGAYTVTVTAANGGSVNGTVAVSVNVQ